MRFAHFDQLSDPKAHVAEDLIKNALSGLAK